MSGYNPSDDDNNDSPLLIRIPNSGDAAAVDRQTGEDLAKLTTEQQANMTIPTPAEVSAAGLIGDAQEALQGTPQDQIEVSRLSDQLSALKAKVVQIRATGSMVPRKLENELIAKENSLNFQMDRMRANTPDPVQVEADSDQQLLLNAYETDMRFAVNRMMIDQRVDKGTALGLIKEKRATLGDAAVLPQYARINARMLAKYPQADS